MFALMSVIGVAMGTIVATVRRERRQEQAEASRHIASERRASP
jgi:hypothetical protein